MPRKSSAANNAKRSTFNVRQAVGSNIKRRRLALGWSQQELADRFGVSRAAISQYELGTGEVNAGDLPRLADILGISLLEFYEGPFFDLRANSIEDRNWAIEAATLLLEKHGLLHQNLSNADGELAQRIKDDIFILDDWLGVTYRIPHAFKHRRDIDSVIRLVNLADRFLALSLQDQETLARVAGALRDKPVPASEKGR